MNAWGFAFREEGRPQELDEIRAQIGKGADLLVPTLLPDADDALRQRIADAHGRHFKGMYLDHVRAFPGASALIARVAGSGRKVVLASSAARDELEHYVALLGVGELLAASTSIDDVEASKPEPDIFGVGLAKIGVAANRAMVVGDTSYDVEAARRAGIAAIGVTSGPFTQDQLKEAGAVAVFADVADLLARFDRSPLAA